MVNKCFPHMIEDGRVWSKKCAADEKTQRRAGPESNDLAGQGAGDVCAPKWYLSGPCAYTPKVHFLQSKNKSTQKYLQPSASVQLNVI